MLTHGNQTEIEDRGQDNLGRDDVQVVTFYFSC
jgi:hypothetical protein